MKFSKSIRSILFLAGIFALIAIACGGSAPDDPNAPTRTPRPTATPKITVELELINKTQKPLCYLFVSPSDEEFKKEYLDGTEIAPGESYTVSGFDAGEYNAKTYEMAFISSRLITY